MENISIALRLKKELDTMRPFNEDDEARIMQKFRLDWNFHSNNLEGNSLSYGETKALILFGITASGKPLKDHFEITGHNEAINEILEVVKQQYPLTESFIRELHKLILKEPYKSPAITLDGKPSEKTIQVGTYKTSANHVKTVTGEIFRFATPEETPAKMHDLINWYRAENEKSNINPIILAAEFHYKFVRIHPFDDGNGRLARILMNFILLQHGFPPVIVRTQDKQNYIAAIRQADAGLRERFENYIAKNLVQSLELMIRGAKGEDIEDDDDADKAFALLDKRIEGLGVGEKGFFSEKTLVELFDNSLLFLFQKLLAKNKKFEKYYQVSELGGCAIGTNESYSESYFKEDIKIEDLSKLIAFYYDGQTYNEVLFSLSDLVEFSWYSVFRNFIKKGIENFNFSSSIKIEFKYMNYIVKIKDESLSLTKDYGEQLTEKEINKIVNSEIKRHTDFIQKKLDEAEKKDKQ